MLERDPTQRPSAADIAQVMKGYLRDAARRDHRAPARVVVGMGTAGDDLRVTTITRHTPFVGRDSERATIARLVDRAVSGRGSVLFIGGEPGVGKTRLAEDALSAAQARGCLALTGRCYESDGTPPFVAWVEIVEHFARIVPRPLFREFLADSGPAVAMLVPELRQLFPHMPRSITLPPDQQRRFVFNNLLSFFKRATRATPHVLLIDDLQWADASTLLLLLHIAQHVSQLSLLILATYRDVELDASRPLAEALERLTRQRLAQRRVLRPLSESGVRDMLLGLSDQFPPSALVKDVYRDTEGKSVLCRGGVSASL